MSLPNAATSPKPNLFLYKIQDVLEVQVVVIVSDALLDVGVENGIHLGMGEKINHSLDVEKAPGKYRKM